ncbi:MAG TPA: polysaccharide deacetylase family protein [Xanthobacteraceae bacterium]|nr:polysaccharide deacetylase family protein [Xanthobacteraceae bacterium]
MASRSRRTPAKSRRVPARKTTAKSARRASAAKFWPDGARLAISISLMVESPAEPPQMFLAPDGKRYPDLPAETGIQYGYREGIPRLLDLFDRVKIKCSSFISGNCVDLIPEIGVEIAQRGHECAAHGKMHDWQMQMPREEEYAFIKEGVDSVTRVTGQIPLGYNCKALRRSPNTLSILQELGFLYHIDDVSRDEPFIIPVNGKPFVVVPYTRHLNDFEHFVLTQQDGVAYERALHDEFDALYEEAEHKRRMMVISWHDRVARPARVRVLKRFIEHAQKQKGVWFARKDDIAKWALQSDLTIRESEAV